MCVNGWMDGWMFAWMCVCIYVCMHECINVCNYICDYACITSYKIYIFTCFFLISPFSRDVIGAPWDEVVNALLSNTEERSKTVTLVFERELPDDDEDEEEAPATA